MSSRAAVVHTQTIPAPAPAKFEPHKQSLIGEIIGLKYRIDSKIGQGGLAVVYKATDIQTNNAVAIKVMGKTGAVNLDLALREANYLRQFNHPNILKCFDVGIQKVNGADAYYIVTEFLDGETLDKRLKQSDDHFRWEAIRSGMRDVAEALDHMHYHGIVHRDIKPENIFVATIGRRKVFKIIDVGIAKRLDEQHEEPGCISGTPNYLAPETIGNNSTAASDQYAFGAVVYELLSGQDAIPGDNVQQILRNQIMYTPEPVRKVANHVPKSVERIIARCLDKDPKRRFANMAEVADAIDDTRGTSYSQRELRKMNTPKSSRSTFLTVAIAAAAAAIIVACASLVGRLKLNTTRADSIEAKIAP